MAETRQRSTGGFREHLGIYVRSSWENNWICHLNWLKIPWEYEPKTFWFEGIKRGCRFYTPDVLVKEKGKSQYFAEIKGWMDAKSKTKLKRMAKYYPEEKIVIIGKEFFQDCERKRLCRLIPHWECKHNEKLTVNSMEKI